MATDLRRSRSCVSVTQSDVSARCACVASFWVSGRDVTVQTLRTEMRGVVVSFVA